MTLDPKWLDELEGWTDTAREIIQTADQRASATDGPCPPTAEMMDAEDIQACLSALWFVCENAPALLAAAREGERLREAIVWALGYTDFQPRGEGDGPYWWRRELHKRSGLTNKECAQIADLARGARDE